MELSWSTFVLEIVNFLVLLWILKHFLYTPVMAVIARRKLEIEKDLADAERVQHDAQELQIQYESRLSDWDIERLKARDALNVELDTERNQKMEEIRKALVQEQGKWRIAEERRQADAQYKLENIALTQSAKFATKILKNAAGKETESYLIELAVDEMNMMSDEDVSFLQNSHELQSCEIHIESAYSIDTEKQQKLTHALHRIVTPEASVQFQQNRELIAGVSITIGAWVLGANIRDELKGFVELFHND